MAGEQAGLDADALAQVDAMRAQMRDTMQFVAALGDGGWNHGAKVVYAAGDLMNAAAAGYTALKRLEVESRE
jgi:hypothetical protein